MSPPGPGPAWRARRRACVSLGYGRHQRGRGRAGGVRGTNQALGGAEAAQLAGDGGPGGGCCGTLFTQPRKLAFQ